MVFIRCGCSVVFLLVVVAMAAQPVPEAYRAKCSPAILAGADRADAGRYTVVAADGPAFRAWLQEQGLPVVVGGGYRPAHILLLEVSRTVLLETILPNPQVRFVDRGPGQVREELYVPGHNLYVNAINAVHADYPDINGRDRTVSIKEQRFDTADVDIRGRVTGLDQAAVQSSFHAAQMATLIGGAGTTGSQARGVALGCRLSSSDFASTLPDDPAYYNDLGIAVQNHSYGVGIENFYGAEAMAFDQSVREQPTLLHVFSSGNSGTATSLSGPYAGVGGMANLTGNFKMAKNALVVGAVDSFGRVQVYSSHGPAYDGRLKPDLVAFGYFGSSESAALVSGSALLLQQAYTDIHGDSLPPAALLRALLLNTTDDAGLPGPDHITGYGNLQAHRALRTLLNGQFALGTATSGDKVSVEIDVPPDISRLQVLLAWDDVSGSPGASRALVHDLDLRLTGPDGLTYWLPWVAPSAPDSAALQEPAQRRRDSLNTVEQVSLEQPDPGTYRLEVDAPAGLTAPQAFVLTWRLDSLATLRWTYPRRGDAVSGNQTLVVRWEPADGSAELAYRLGDQAGWTVLDTAVDLRRGYAPWPAPDTLSFARLRLRAGNRAWVSDSFLLAPELRMKVGYLCPDSLLLFWNKAGALARYQLWALSGRYLERVRIEEDTVVVLSRAEFAQSHFAVSPLGTDGLEGGRSGGIDPNLQATGCYFQAFLARFVPGEGVRLGVVLGTVAGLQSVAVERWNGIAFDSLQVWAPPGATALDFTDVLAPPGRQQYRARLVRANGNIIFSDTLTVYVPGPEGYLVFPNPVKAGTGVQVVIEEPGEAKFVLTDALGRVMIEQLLEDVITDVPISHLSHGFYPWFLRWKEHPRMSGVIIILR